MDWENQHEPVLVQVAQDYMLIYYNFVFFTKYILTVKYI